ncbi:MAG: DUF502 domain-containing protein [Planctomycetota bacterium]
MPSDQPHIPERSFGKDFKTFFVRGLAILLPTVLTIWVLAFAYQFVNQNIAGPINAGVRAAVIQFSSWPQPVDSDFIDTYDTLPLSRKQAWDAELSEQKEAMDKPFVESGLPGRPPSERLSDRVLNSMRLEWQKTQDDLIFEARLHAFENKWNAITVGSFRVLNLIGIILAIVLIYIAGVLVTSFIGRRFYRMGENLIARVPLIRNVYPAVKQVTDFFFSSDTDDKINFNRVVAVQYPRKGLWSVGLVTGDTMKLIEETAGQRCLTVFVPSSPTPFTGYVITVPKTDTIDLPISVEEALKFAVSGGVVIPQNQVIDRPGADQMVLPGTEDTADHQDRAQPESN